MEADLARTYHLDYRDRWRTDPHTGRPRLTLRRLAALIEHLPADSAVATAARDGRPAWTVEAHLLDDVRMTLTGTRKKPAVRHPDRPRPAARTRDPQVVTAARRRARRRRQAIADGLIT